MSKHAATHPDQPIPFTVVDPDAPIPYRVRVATPSAELRNFVVPMLSIRGSTVPPAAESEPRLQVA